MKKLITLLLVGVVASFAVIAAGPAGAKKGHPRAHAAKAKHSKRIVHGTVQSVQSDSVTLKGKKGDPVTVQVNGDTKIVVNGKAGALADIQVGFRAIAKLPKGGGAALVLRAAAAPAAGTVVHGVVDSVGSDSITLELRDHSTLSIPVNGDTKIRVNGKAGALSDIDQGYRAVVRRTAADGPAAAINAYAPREHGRVVVRGTVDSVGSDSITIKTHGGATVTVDVTAQTIIRVKGQSASLSDIQQGYRALVLRSAPDGAALAIIALPPKS
jgi:hypothetical protein